MSRHAQQSVGRYGSGDFSRAVFSPMMTLVFWCVCFVVSLVVALMARTRLGEEFGYDAELILKFARGEVNEGGSYRVSAELYKALGLTEHETLASIFGVALGMTLVALVLWRSGGLYKGVVAPVIFLGFSILAGVFLGTYTKEIFIVAALCVLVVTPQRWWAELLPLAAFAIIGLYFRQYWMFVAAAYLALRLIPLRWLKPWILAPLLLIGTVAFSLAIWYVMGRPGDAYRDDVNAMRAGTGETASIILSYFHGAEPLAGVVNNLVAFAILIVPVPLFALGGAYYWGSALIFVELWGLYFWACASRRWSSSVVAHRIVAILGALLSVQALFEPDFGSALRHLTPFIPLFAALWSLRSQSDEGAMDTAAGAEGQSAKELEDSDRAELTASAASGAPDAMVAEKALLSHRRGSSEPGLEERVTAE